MKILNSHQIKEADRATIQREPIISLDLMERAGRAIFQKIKEEFESENAFAVFCGPGNNGGDGLVIARLLANIKKGVRVIQLSGTSFTPECSTKLERIKQLGIPLTFLENEEQLQSLQIPQGAVIIDAIFGGGINRPLEGLAAKLVRRINASPGIKIAIDLPSGLSADIAFPSTPENTVMANYTYTVQLPKLAFMFVENDVFTGQFECVDIGLSSSYIQSVDTPHFYPDREYIRGLIKPRNKFGHKGSFGHACIIAGSDGKIGASILSSKAALRTGCGLLTVCMPESGHTAMHSHLPEAMVVVPKSGSERMDFSKYDAVGFGPGIGTSEIASDHLFELLNLYHSPLVIDADGINCLANKPIWYGFLKSNIILTPHPGEFDRLTRVHENGHERYLAQQHFSKKHHVTIVLKGYHTSVTTPSGKTFFNSTGNNGMATAGSGDVLTGIITSLCAQGYAPEDAAVLGVYLHGFAGDAAAMNRSRTAMIASDITDGIGDFFKGFEK